MYRSESIMFGAWYALLLLVEGPLWMAWVILSLDGSLGARYVSVVGGQNLAARWPQVVNLPPWLPHEPLAKPPICGPQLSKS